MTARLDRALASHDFLNLWLNVELLVLTKNCSDHHPLKLTTTVQMVHAPRSFHFQDIWL